MTDMEMQMIRALAEIDRELGMPDDGCNSTENTITAIRLLHAVRRDDEAEIDRLRDAIDAMRVAGGRIEFHAAFDAAKALLPSVGQTHVPKWNDPLNLSEVG